MSVRNLILEQLVIEDEMMSAADLKTAIYERTGRMIPWGTISGRLSELFEEGYLDKWEPTLNHVYHWLGGWGPRNGNGWTLREEDA